MDKEQQKFPSDVRAASNIYTLQSNAFTNAFGCYQMWQRDGQTPTVGSEEFLRVQQSSPCSTEIKSACLSDGEPDIRPN